MTEEEFKEQENITQQDMAAGYFMALEKARIWVEHFLKDHKDLPAEECLQQLLKLINASSTSIDPLLPKFLQKETRAALEERAKKGKDCDEN